PSRVHRRRCNPPARLPSLNGVRPHTYPLGATSGGYAKRTPIDEYPVQNRGGTGVLTIQYDRRRGNLVGALVVDDETELYAITSIGWAILTTARLCLKAVHYSNVDP